LVEDKAVLMKKLGKKQLILHLLQPLSRVPDELMAYRPELSSDGTQLVYTFHADHGGSTIADLLRKLTELGIGFKDVQSRESSLEDIFVSLVRSRS
jgi:ABC-2 type transport system ATP-binding protein